MGEILAVLFAVLVSMVAITPYYVAQHQGLVNIRSAATAGEERQITQAAQEYIQQYYTTLESATSANNGTIVTIAMLQSTGMLSSAISSTNPYGQTWEVEVLQPTPGTLQALVVSIGGNEIPEGQLAFIASQSGASGGFVPYNGQNGSLTPSSAQGAFGAWTVPLTYYTNPGPGHLASLVAFENGNLENDYLYRVAVPGDSSLNTMQTNLNMGTNNISNTTDYKTTSNLGQLVSNGGAGEVAMTSTDGNENAFMYAEPGGDTAVWADTNSSNYTYMASSTSPSIGDGLVVNGPDGAVLATDQDSYLTSGVFGTGAYAKQYATGNFSAANAQSADGQDVAWMTATGGSSGDSAGIYINSGNTAAFGAGSNGELYVSKQIDLPPVATAGNSCSPNGTLAAAANGATMDCISGKWNSLAVFQTSGTQVISTLTYYYNTKTTPLFISTNCTPTSSSYPLQEVIINVYSPSNYASPVSVSTGQVDAANSGPSASAIVPGGDAYIVYGQNMSCTLAYAQ